MLVQLRNSFTTIRKIHHFFYRPRLAGQNLVVIVTLSLLLLGGLMFKYLPDFPWRDTVLLTTGIILFSFIFLVIPFVYVASILFRQEQGRAKSMADHKTFGTWQFIKFGFNTSIIIMFSLFVLFQFFLKIDYTTLLPVYGEYIVPIFFLIFSIIGVLWFGLLITNDVFDLQFIKVRINQYVAWASVVGLLQLPFLKSILASFGILLVASRFVVYCLEERVLEKKIEEGKNGSTLPST